MNCTGCGIDKSASDFRPQRKNCRACDTQRHKEWRSKNRERLREYDRGRQRVRNWWPSHIARKYQLAPHQYDAMLAAQDGVCAICSTDKPGGNSSRFHIDHDHASGEIRGLLCSRCNQMLGYAQDDPKRLLGAADYLRKPKRSSEPR